IRRNRSNQRKLRKGISWKHGAETSLKKQSSRLRNYQDSSRNCWVGLLSAMLMKLLKDCEAPISYLSTRHIRGFTTAASITCWKVSRGAGAVRFRASVGIRLLRSDHGHATALPPRQKKLYLNCWKLCPLTEREQS